MKDEDLYIGIEEPIKLRRALLESTKALIHVLQANETLRLQRQERQDLTEKLKDTISELYTLLANVRSDMPHIPLSHLPKGSRSQEIVEDTPPIELKTKKHVPNQMSTSDLARELDEIEKKLSELK